MTSSANANANSQTPRSTHLSPESSTATISPTWAPPKSPLPPHRLAKLANALGVSTPMPAVHQPTPFMSRSYLESPASADTFRRSPTPSTPVSNFTAYSPAVSKYLLHVVPPLHLPHDTNDDTDMTPPPPNASGYHTQFRRGTLVPVHSNLQSQLGVIAKEYALPSTAGLVLYLVSSAKRPERGLTPVLMDDEPEEPGPRLSEDIWKHLWTRVLRVEQRDDSLMPPRSPFGMALGAQSTPYLPHEMSGQSLRPFLSSTTEHSTPALPSSPFPPSPSTPSTASDPRSNTRSAPPSESSVCDPETPDTSSAAPSMLKDPESRAKSLDLPGLMSPSIIPILAKVEFDIDRRRAAWYEPWIRSRRMNHAKRAESRNGRQESRENSDSPSDGSQEHVRHIGFLTGNKEAQSTNSLLSPMEESLVAEPETIDLPMAEGYQQLDEEELEMELEGEQGGWSDDSDDDEFEPTTRVATLTLDNHKDALADVFGTDAETWADLKASSPRDSKHQTNPNVVNLALNPADLTALPSPTQSEFETLGKEEDEVQALLEQMSRASLPTSPVIGVKKHVPPPLTLVTNPPPKDLATSSDPLPSSNSTAGLAYLSDGSDEMSPEQGDEAAEEEGIEVDYTRVKSPAESVKRGGAVFDDLDLGLDPTEDYDDDDPHDRRRSQFLMRAQLDEIERTMAQLSPRILQTDLADEQTYLPLSPSNSMTLSPGKMNADYYPPSPRLPQHPEVPDSPLSQPQAAWPATPFASLKNTSPPRRRDAPPSPPRLAVNGITTSAPKSYMPNASGEMSAESEQRKRELEEEQGYHPPSKTQTATDSPIIPLSPDPFGRFASTPPISSGAPQTTAYWDNGAIPSISSVTTPAPIVSPDGRKRSGSSATSRFSADSITGVEANSNANLKPNRATLMTVNTFKKLWRKSTKSTTSSNPPSAPSATSVPPVPGRPERPSQEQSDEPPKTPIFGRFSPQPAPHRRSQDVPPPPVPQAPPQLSVPVAPQQQRPIPQLQPSPQPQPQQPPQALTPPVPTPQPHQRSSISHPQPQPALSPQQRPPIPHGQQQPQYPVPPAHPHHQSMTIPQQLSVPPPPFNGRSANPQPIVATQMRPSRSNSTLDRFQFDQESPYPITRRAPTGSRPASPPPVPSPTPQTIQLPPPTPTMSHESLPKPMIMGPPMVPPEKPNIRKSILKGWKSSSISSTASAQQAVGEPRSSLERPNAGAVRGKRPSVLNFGSSRSSVVSPPLDIPPSPQIPQQFMTRHENRQSIRSKLTNSSIDSSHSPPKLSGGLGAETASRRSMASSRSSQESRPSFDTSQFEMVSPKMGSALSYPYHGLDHSMDHSAEGQ
ncbi:hypothetical protein DXG01_001026 [Tephrocybe rancida]|nr:hypothetical protein DXG01_001026 [Tephrocybe rancida]